jgi:hypothetical protein
MCFPMGEWKVDFLMGNLKLDCLITPLGVGMTGMLTPG